MTTDGIKGHWLYQDRCDGRPQQQWESNVINHLYFIPNSVSYRNPSTGFAWDVQGYSLNRGANIVGWSEKGDQFDVLNQLFTEV